MGCSSRFTFRKYEFWQYDELRQGYNLHFHTHNELAEHLVSLGLIGGFLFIIYIYFIFKFSGKFNFFQS